MLPPAAERVPALMNLLGAGDLEPFHSEPLESLWCRLDVKRISAFVASYSVCGIISSPGGN